MAARQPRATTTDASATTPAAARPAAKTTRVATKPAVEGARLARRGHRSVNGAARPASGALAELNVTDRLGFVVRVAGSKAAAARLLDVDAAQTTRWAAGAAEPAGPQAVRLLDLEYVMAHAKLVWGTDELVVDWLGTPNAHLDHARPVDYIRLLGTAAVVEALRAEAVGAYA